jgi:tetratricopeptide (TPR) repeat protein
MSRNRVGAGLVLGVWIVLAAGQAPAQTGERTEFPPEARKSFDRGRDLQQKGQFQDAINAFEEAIRLGMKDYPRAHLYKANSALELKRYESAVAQYSEFIEQFSLEDSCRY